MSLRSKLYKWWMKQRSGNISPTKIIALVFAAIILCGTILLMLPAASRNGVSCGWLPALFTATSATCVTGLASQGVRIFTYTPGFVHAKMCLCDGDLATVGTSNLDYRSLYLHFENNVLLYGCDAVKSIEEDFEAMFRQCAEVTDTYRSGRNAILRTWQCLLRLFAPLM